MKANPDNAWSTLVRRARADVPPPSDLAPLLRAVREEAARPPATSGFGEEFAALFASPAALTLSAACVAFAGWSVAADWRRLSPWIDLASASLGNLL